MRTLKEILKQRAKEAAKILEDDALEELVDVIRFKISNEVYAVRDKYVREVYPYLQPTKVPCAPPFILGILNVRGAFVSVVDLGLILGLEKSELKKEGFILLLSNETMEFGVMVDEIEGEMKIPKKSVQAIPEGLNVLTKDLIEGVTVDGLIMLDGKRLLEDSKIVVREEV